MQLPLLALILNNLKLYYQTLEHQMQTFINKHIISCLKHEQAEKAATGVGGFEFISCNL